MIRLYALPVSGYCTKVRIVLRIKDIPFEETPPLGGHYSSAAYQAHMPPGTMPSIVGSFPTSTAALHAVLDGNLLFVADDVSGVQILDVSDPTLPDEIGYYVTPYATVGVSVAEDLAFVIDEGGGLFILSLAKAVYLPAMMR